MKIQTLAAVDIGSNAIRLLISNIETYKTENEIKKLAFLRVPIRLGEDVFTIGAISDDKAMRLEQAIIGFSHIMKAYNVLGYRICATSAMREAANGQQVADRILESSGLQIEIISGQQEADTIFAAGVLSEALEQGGSFLYVDVGGGSTEVIAYAEGRKQCARSFRLGTVRMLTTPNNDDEMDAFKAFLREVASNHKPTKIIGSGGNINKVQRMLGKKDKESITFLEMQILYKTLKTMSFEQRVHELGLNTYRADVIVPALKIFTTVAKTCKISTVEVPRQGLADGIIKQLYNTLVTKL